MNRLKQPVYLFAGIWMTAACMACGVPCGAADAEGLMQKGSAAEELTAENSVEIPVLKEAGRQIPFSEDPSAIETAAASSVVMLDVYDRNDMLLTRGSGFLAITDQTVITSMHVIENMEYVNAVTEGGAEYRIETIVFTDEDTDTAVLLLPEEALFDESLKPLPISSGEELRGEKAVVIGSVRGVQNLVTIGNICGHWESRKIRWILFSAPVSAGASGGPLINDKGEVTGIVIGSYNNMQNLNLAAPVSILEEYHKAGEF